jgi:hypothetical protein
MRDRDIVMDFGGDIVKTGRDEHPPRTRNVPVTFTKQKYPEQTGSSAVPFVGWETETRALRRLGCSRGRDGTGPGDQERREPTRDLARDGFGLQRRYGRGGAAAARRRPGARDMRAVDCFCLAPRLRENLFKKS